MKSKKDFKNNVKSGIIHAKVNFLNGKSLSGEVYKYTGQEIKIVD